ncbi:hypothetical protein LC605_27815 [Nostoc sp. CHAB 5836]|uniref:hypothetical protein n=1 Tax=Nostoc sp. CHAB 5836 TaxID=2780404 RepID=UPI001E60E31F|nr:hypothetical protein [Nostoc sp. CHAB 5836]MCC5618827.1 hypothetical protein [Nostoc sp. CHAB 5836]
MRKSYINQSSTRVIEYRQTSLKKKIKYTGGLLASTNNYITGDGEGKLMANLIAQLFHDTNSWNNPSKKNKRYIACLIGPTYTPLELIRSALLEWNYICEDVPDTKKETLKKYDGLIARVVKVPELPFIFGENVEGIASMLKAGKIVYLGGCGCPFGSLPFNDILNRLGFSWSVQETRSLSQSEKPQVVYPWVVQRNLKAGINETRDYMPQITDRTVFSNVKKSEVIVKSKNGQVMMAYSPYPDCLKYLKNLNP